MERTLRSLVTLPFLFEIRKRGGGAPPKLQQEPEIAVEVLERNFRGFRKTLHALEPGKRDSRWSDYQVAADHYSDQERQQKQAFVDRAMQLLRPGSVLDIGGNTGHYSRIAASVGARVVAWDTDVASSDRSWRQARQNGLPIRPWSPTWPGRLRPWDGVMPNLSPCWNGRTTALIAS